VKWTRRKNVPWILVVVILVGSLAAILDPLTFLRGGQYRGEVRALYDTLQLDMSKEQVQRAMDTAKYPHLKFRQVEDAVWFASAPYEFGAQNWVLLIEFQGERVSALRVRTDDGFKDFQRPAEAPPDRVRAGVKIDDVTITTVDSGLIVQYRTATPSADCTAQANELPKVWDLVVKARVRDPSVGRVILFPEDTSRQSVSFTFTKQAAGHWTAVAPCSVTIPAR
jgi:hypothetical protein